MKPGEELTQTQILGLPEGASIRDGGGNEMIRLPEGWVYAEIRHTKNVGFWAVKQPRAFPPYTLARLS